MNLPNRLTLLRIFCVPIYLVLLGMNQEGPNIAAFCVFAFAALTDLLDGRIARARGLVTNFGKFMDPIADKLLVLPALILMVSLGRVPAWMCILFVARELIVSGLRMVAVEQGVVIAAGPLGKLKTVLQCLAILSLTVYAPFLGWVSTGLLWAALVLTVWSGIDYLYHGRHLLWGGSAT